MIENVVECISKAKKWQEVMAKLRVIAHEATLTGIEAGLRYTWQDCNIVVMHDIKDCCASLQSCMSLDVIEN